MDQLRKYQVTDCVGREHSVRAAGFHQTENNRVLFTDGDDAPVASFRDPLAILDDGPSDAQRAMGG